MLKQTMTVLGTTLSLWVSAQSAEWLTSGNTGQHPVNDFLGNTDAIPMNIRTQDILRFRLLPDANYAIGLFPPQVKDGSLLLGGDVDSFYANGGPGPFSALHLVHPNTSNAQARGFRPWMQNGITFTGNSDLGYIGQKYKVDGEGDPIADQTDMVVNWSNDHTDQWGPDHLSFRFTSNWSSGSSAGFRSLEGLEGMRLLPVDSTQINVGIGDFVAGLDEPTERLDVRTGKVRVRELPSDPVSASTEFVTVNMTNGVLEHRPLGALPDNCEWSMSTTSPNNVYTAVGAPNGACPDASERVGIGTFGPTYKLDVRHNEANGSLPMPGGLNVEIVPDATGSSLGVRSLVTAASGSAPADIYGVWTQTKNATNNNHTVRAYSLQETGTASQAIAGYFTAKGSGGSTSVGATYGVYTEGLVESGASVPLTFGLYGRGTNSTSAAYGLSGYAQTQVNLSDTTIAAYGVHGHAKGGSKIYGVYGKADQSGAKNFGTYGHAYGASGSRNYGVYGLANGGSVLNCSVYGASAGNDTLRDWSGYFANRVQIQGDLYHGAAKIFSDASLKDQVSELPNMSQQIQALRPKRYQYNQAAQERMGLSGGEQFGFIAQEVQEVLPQLVSSTIIAAELDTLGNVVRPEMSVRAVNYVGLIPLLVGNAQDQIATSNAQAGELAALREELEQQRNRLEQLEHLLAACCANPDRALPQPGSDTVIPAFAGMTPGGEKLRIQPNPFNERTTVFYKLDNGGRTQLMANSADGKDLRVLHEATLEKGDYQYEWNTAALAPGMYYVTLLVDGQPVVKKAVKVDR